MKELEIARLRVELLELIAAAGLRPEDLGYTGGTTAPGSVPATETSDGPGSQQANRTMPTLADYVAEVHAAIQSSDSETARTYRSYWRLLSDGVRGEAHWDEVRERRWLADLAAVNLQRAYGLTISAEPDDYERSLDRRDTGALVVWPGYGSDRIDEITQTKVNLAIKWLRTRVLAEARRRDRLGALQGQPPCDWTGDSAVETLIAATRMLYAQAAGDGLVPETFSPAARIGKPARGSSNRRPMSEEELADIRDVCQTTGRDPELDMLLFKFHLTTAARQEGAINLNLEHLIDKDACIVIADKGSLAKRGNTRQPDDRVPVPPKLIAELRAFAASRGSSQPGDPVFRYLQKHRRTGAAHPRITSRRYDSFHKRIRRHLAWAAEERWSTHWLRHQAAAEMAQLGGEAVKERFLRHKPNGQTAMYGRAKLEHVAWVVAMRVGEPHPMAELPPGR